MAKSIVAKLINYEGVLVQTLALPYFMQEVQLARMRRLSLSLTPADPEDVPLQTDRRRFRFHDREGKFHIYKEV